MKVALVVPGGVDRSGEYRVIPALLALLKRLALHHEVHVFALAQERSAARWKLVGAQIHNVGTRSPLLRAIGSICSEHRRAPFSLVHSIWSGGCGLIAVTTAKLLRIPSFVHVAGGELAQVPEIGYGGRLHWYGRVREIAVLRSATVVSAASQPMIQAIAAVGIQARQIPLGVDLDEWPPRHPVQRELRGGAARLIHVASLNRVKDQATLLEALAALDASGVRFHADIVGEDTLRGKMQALAAQLGLAERVTFHGFLPQRQLRPLMEAAHVHILSSRHEAGPVAMLEAAVAGVPTVGTAVGHIAEWAPAAAAAVPVGAAAELARVVARLLADEGQRLKIAQEAWRRATTQDADYTAARVLETYSRFTTGRQLTGRRRSLLL